MTDTKKQSQSDEIQAIKRPNGGTAFKVESEVTIDLKTTASAMHEARWNAKSYAILAILLALFLGLVSLISFGISKLLPLPTWLEIILTIIIFCILVIIGWWRRYHILMFIHCIDRKSIVRKKFHSK